MFKKLFSFCSTNLSVICSKMDPKIYVLKVCDYSKYSFKQNVLIMDSTICEIFVLQNFLEAFFYNLNVLGKKRQR